MSDAPLSSHDYPVAEKWPDRVTGQRGRALGDVTLDAAARGDLEMEDLRITPEALLRQAQIARSVGRAALARNFERAAEMTRLPQDEVMRLYELLRPGRSETREDLLKAAHRLRDRFDAPLLAGFVEEAAALYTRRGLFRARY
jgi:propanediol dehydratase small subunit